MMSKPVADKKISIVSSRMLCLAVLVSISLGFALFGENGVLRLKQVCQQQALLQLQTQQLQEANAQLCQQIDALQHDDAYLERLARSRLSLVRDEEIVYRFAPQLAN
ncbi:MAG: hypothetical protein B6I36_00700 [Desulfobacteraceae bacterium 4572_35.1]|nr:MAG: hypothetical protein B6I36_00700 [Desulfobacteraceae bacterium 4572_35.1]